jgi:hypothetical protein
MKICGRRVSERGAGCCLLWVAGGSDIQRLVGAENVLPLGSAPAAVFSTCFQHAHHPLKHRVASGRLPRPPLQAWRRLIGP